MGDVVNLRIIAHDMPADSVLHGALKAKLEDAIVIGYDEDGVLYLASTTGECGNILLALEHAKMEVMKRYAP